MLATVKVLTDRGIWNMPRPSTYQRTQEHLYKLNHVADTCNQAANVLVFVLRVFVAIVVLFVIAVCILGCSLQVHFHTHKAQTTTEDVQTLSEHTDRLLSELRDIDDD